MKNREQIINEAIRIRNEIKQIFLDARYWNEMVRLPHEPKINPDPDGELERQIERLDAMIGNSGVRKPRLIL